MGGFPIVGFAFFLLCLTESALASPTEGRLIDTLLKNYNKLTRPVALEKDVVSVKIGMSLLQIISVDEKQQILTTNIWLRTIWPDVSMIWNPLEYDNQTAVRIPMSRLWKPDILVYNIADEEIFQSTHHLGGMNAYIFHNGSVIFVPPMILKTTCKMDVTWFPFDEQRCEIKLGSWTYSTVEMNVEFVGGNMTFDLDDYVPNGEWKLLGFETKRVERFYECCPEGYVSVKFILHIKRERMYYFFNLIVPCALIGFLAILGFTLPPDSGEKLSLGVTVLFSLIVFLNMIAESMPSNSDAVPLLGTYFNCVMFMIASSVVSTIVVNIKVRSAHLPPKDVGGGAVTQKLLFTILPWMLRMEAKNEFLPKSGHGNRLNKSYVGEGVLTASPLREVGEENKYELTDFNDELSGSAKIETGDGDEEGILKKKWMYVAEVVDRFCLAVSVLFILISVAVLLVSTLC